MAREPNVTTEEPKSAGDSESSSGSKIVVVDLGKKQRRKQIKRLRKGEGRLVDKVHDVIDELRENGTVPAGNQSAIVVVVREKKRKRMGGFLF